MGFFGSSKKTFVATETVRVIEDKSLPDSVLEGLGRDWKEGTQDIVGQISDSLVNSIAVRAGRMYAFGKNHYTYGLPTGSVFSSHAGREASEAVLQSISGGPVTMLYYHFGTLNLLHLGWKLLTEQKGYDALTNKIGVLSTPERPVFLKNMRVVVTNATVDELANGSLDQWGTPPSAGPTPEKYAQTAAAGALVETMNYVVDPTAAADYILVDTCWKEGDQVKFGTFTMALTGIGYDPLKDYHQAKYVDHLGLTHYWLYDPMDGVHNDLDNVFEKGYDNNGHFFPWLWFRFNKKNEGDDKTSQGYKDCRKLGKILSMNYDKVLNGIHDNPDINDVEQAFMTMAVPANSDNPIEQRYLFDFFSGLYLKSKALPDQFPNTAETLMGPTVFGKLMKSLNKSTMIIQDKRFKMSINWKSIVKRKVMGSIGRPGTYKALNTKEDVVLPLPSLSGDPVPMVYDTSMHAFQHQITKDVYEEVRVDDLEVTYYIFEGYNTTATDNAKTLLIPVDISITKDYAMPDREQLYARSLHYIFNSRITIKLKWYQTGIFRIIVIIIMIIITILSKGATMQGLIQAIVAGTITWGVLLMMLVQYLIKQLIIMLLIRLFVKIVGPQFAFLAAIVAIIYGGYEAIQAGSVQGAPWASEMMTVASGIGKEISRETQIDFQELAQDRSEFQKYMDDQTNMLKDTQDLLNQNQRLAPIIVFGESPDDFYHRTVHSGNIGVIGLDAVTSFVDVALTLPKISDTL